MKHLKTYQLFESRTGLTKGQENFLNKYTKGTWSYNPATGLVDVEGDFGFNGTKRKNLSGVRFGKVSGYFYCWGNILTSLEGAPQEVGGDFSCDKNRLTSLEGAPQVVGGDFSCYENKLTSLAGAPQEVGRDFNCVENKLTSLEGAPQEVSGDFRCFRNNLTSLAGAPLKVGGDFHCFRNNLTSLAGAPQEVGGDFSCYKNRLASLEGAPQEVGGDFDCGEFQLDEEEWNLKGWLKVLNEGTPEAQKLISAILSAEALNKEIQKDPAGMAMKLKEVWNDGNFKEIRSKLVWPKGYGDSADLVGDLDDIGF